VQNLRDLFENYGGSAKVTTDAVAVRSANSEEQLRRHLQDSRAAATASGRSPTHEFNGANDSGGLGCALAAYLLLPCLVIAAYAQTAEFPSWECFLPFLYWLAALFIAGCVFRFIRNTTGTFCLNTAAGGNGKEADINHRRWRQGNDGQLGVVVWSVLAVAAVAFLVMRSVFVSELPPTDTDTPS
jgi:hypothetical protein